MKVKGNNFRFFKAFLDFSTSVEFARLSSRPLPREKVTKDAVSFVTIATNSLTSATSRSARTTAEGPEESKSCVPAAGSSDRVATWPGI